MLKTKDKWEYAPIGVGFLLILLGVAVLILELQNANLNGYNPSGWLNFYQFWVVIISFCFIAGAFLVVIGIFFLKRIDNILSYALFAAGFAIITFEVSRLLIQLGENNTLVNSGIGWSNFQEYWSFSFFSFLTAGIFLITVGVIFGLQAKNKAGYVTVSGGLAIILFGLSLLSTNLATSLNYYPSNYLFSIQEAWNSTISYSLIAGTLMLMSGAILLLRRRRKTDKIL